MQYGERSMPFYFSNGQMEFSAVGTRWPFEFEMLAELFLFFNGVENRMKMNWTMEGVSASVVAFPLEL
jgi:hypothetical protein